MAPTRVVARPRLEQRLDQASGCRLTTVVAEAGFGKSTLLSLWAADRRAAWLTVTADDVQLPSLARGLVGALRFRVPTLPADVVGAAEGLLRPNTDAVEAADACADFLCDALDERLSTKLTLIIDDLHELRNGPASVRLIHALCYQAPPALHLVLSSRMEPPFGIARLIGQGQVSEIAGSELALSANEIAELAGDPDIAPVIGRVTGGWPAAVWLALEALRDVPPGEQERVLEALRQPGGRLFSYLATEVFRRQSARARHLLRTIAPLERVCSDLCAAFGFKDAAPMLASLLKRGLFVQPDPTAVGWFAVTEPARQFLLEHAPFDQQELSEVHRRAADWLEAAGRVEEALASLATIADHEGIRRLLHAHGAAMLAGGAVDKVLEAEERLPAGYRDAAIEELFGQARQIRGDWEGALRCFKRLAATPGPLAAGLAWRMGLIYHVRGDLERAKRVYERGADSDGAPKDQALLLTWRATVDWLQGDKESCSEHAGRALEIASAIGDAQALAAAHTVLAMLAALTGDRSANDAHYLRALHHAESAGDVLQQIRIRTNRGSQHLEEGAYEDALAELDIALRLSDLAGFQFYRALALTNRGEARFALGRLEEAVADLNAARSLYQRLGSHMVSYPLLRLGDVLRERGNLALARAAYEEAIDRSRDARDMQVLVPALAGLARVLAEEQPGDAERLVEEALREGPGMAQVAALLAQGWVALGGNSRGVAWDAARAAARAARARRDRPGLAEALELEALAMSDRPEAARRLDEAAEIWQELDAPIPQARTELARGLLIPGPAGASQAQDAKDRLRALGVRAIPAPLARLASAANAGRTESVAIESLGTFRVLRQGEPVPLREWQSRKARDLLKIMVARRGRATPREVLMEGLWPDEDPLKVTNRLSVALSIVRAVLDPDKRFEPDYFVIGDKSTVALSLAHLDVDVEHFAKEAAAGLAGIRTDRRSEAMQSLATAADRYVGDFLEEDIYEDWAQSLREELRAMFIRVSRALAEEAAGAGDYEASERHLLRILERDQYDEPAHLRLVSVLLAARRHGEARRRFRAYTARMAEVGIEPATFAGSAEPVAGAFSQP